MERTALGRTGLDVSVMGLGCGGHSRLGLSQGKSTEEAAEIVRAALDLGINFIDTAEGYKTEEAVGRGIRGVSRESAVISTKLGVTWSDARDASMAFDERVEGCLRRLGTDYVDILHLHGVAPNHYVDARDTYVPELIKLREAGKVRYFGITEAFIHDTRHEMLQKAVEDDCWDVVMVGFNLLNPSARKNVLPATRAKGIGTLCMFAVRRALSQPDALRDLMDELAAQDQIRADDLDRNAPLGFLGDVVEGAYRFCRHEPGIDVVLSGTGNADHLRRNAAALARPPLSAAQAQKLEAIFGNVDTVSGN